jgi:methionine-rich copper-binding protein CopC
VRSRPATAAAAPAVPVAPRRSAVHVGVAVGAAAFLVLSLSVAWLGLRRERGPGAATTQAAPAAPSAATAADASRTAETPSAPEDAPRAPGTEAPARLAIDFEHALKSGTLRVWVDEDLLLNTRLESRETKKLIAFKSRKGTVTEVLDVKPGAHSIRVQVTSEDGARTQTISGTLRSGATRRLEIRLKKNLSLDWS